MHSTTPALHELYILLAERARTLTVALDLFDDEGMFADEVRKRRDRVTELLAQIDAEVEKAASR